MTDKIKASLPNSLVGWLQIVVWLSIVIIFIITLRETTLANSEKIEKSATELVAASNRLSNVEQSIATIEERQKAFEKMQDMQYQELKDIGKKLDKIAEKIK